MLDMLTYETIYWARCQIVGDIDLEKGVILVNVPIANIMSK